MQEFKEYYENHPLKNQALLLRKKSQTDTEAIRILSNSKKNNHRRYALTYLAHNKEKFNYRECLEISHMSKQHIIKFNQGYKKFGEVFKDNFMSLSRYDKNLIDEMSNNKIKVFHKEKLDNLQKRQKKAPCFRYGDEFCCF